MKTFLQFFRLCTGCICFGLFIRDFQFIPVFAIFHYDMGNHPILQALHHIFPIFIAFVCHHFQDCITCFFPDAFHGRTEHAMIRHLIGHFKVPDQMCFRIYRCLGIICNRKTIFIFHKSCIGICQWHLWCTCFLHQFLIGFISGKTFLCFFQFRLNYFSGKIFRRLFQILLFIHLLQYPQVLIRMCVQPFDPVVQLIFCKVSVLRIIGHKLASVNRKKAPFHCTGDSPIKFMENLFQAVDVIFPKIRDCTEIRLCATQHPFHFEIHFAAFSQFSWGTDSLAVPINIEFIHSLRIIRWPPLLSSFFYPVFYKVKTVYESINKSRYTLRIYERIPGAHHHLCTIKSRNIWHNPSPHIVFLVFHYTISRAKSLVFCVLYSVFNVQIFLC